MARKILNRKKLDPSSPVITRIKHEEEISKPCKGLKSEYYKNVTENINK